MIRFLMTLLLTALWWVGATAQDWAVADTMVVETDSTDYEALVQRDFNALQYTLDSYHRYEGDRCPRPLTFVSMGGGRMTINDNSIYNPAALHLVNFSYGRQLNELRSIRLNLIGGLGLIQRHSTGELYKTTNGYFALEADYLYSVSSFLLGYRPERTLDVSGFVGLGVGYSQRFESEVELLAHQLSSHHFTGRVRGGVQLKFYAGPQAAVALEPYAYISTRAIDLVRPEYEFYNYRMGSGVDISYVYYLDNRLTVRGNEGLFKKHFTPQQRHLADDMPVGLMLHPFVLGVQGGLSGISSNGHSLSESKGPVWSASLAWWLSPMLAIRARGGIDYINMHHGHGGSKARYIHGSGDLLFNPLASANQNNWQAVSGMALVLGYEGGRFYDGSSRFPGFGYHGGLELWTHITDGVALTLEPQYVRLTHNGEGNYPQTVDMMRLHMGVDIWLATGNGVGHHASNYPLGRMGIAVGRGAAAAGVAVAKGVSTASVAVARGVSTAGVAVANGVSSAGVAVGRGVADAARTFWNQTQRPFFFEYALGYQHIFDMPTNGIDTWEPQIQVGAGWWPMAGIGLRAGTDFLRGSSSEELVKAQNGDFTRYNKLRLSFVYADVLINPLGFRRRYNWQSAAGLNLVAGRLVGNLARGNVEERYWKGGWRLGAQLWTRLDEGLRLNVEPLYTLGECEPQSTDGADYTSSPRRNVFSLKVGMTVMMPDKAHRQQTTPDSLRRRWFVGAGGGVHFNKDLYRLSGGGTNSNVQLMAGYRLTPHSVVRLSEELTWDHFIDPCTYQLTSGADAGRRRSGLGVTTYRFLFSSLAYQYDLLAWARGHEGTRVRGAWARRWQVNVLGGFALSYYLNESTSVPGETAAYTVSHGERVSKANGNLMLGLMVGYRLSERLSAYFNHHLMIYSFGRPQWLHYSSQIRTYSGNVNLFNAGLTWDL